MNRLIERSIFLALTCVVAISLAGLGICYGLNPRFVDSVWAGLVSFLLLPVAAAVPLAIFAALLGIFCRGHVRRHGALLITVVVAAVTIPVLIFLIHAEASALFGSRRSVAVCVEVALALFAVLGIHRVGRVISLLLYRSDRPRWSVAGLLFLATAVAVPIAAFRSHRPIERDGRDHLVIFGVDGADWKIIDPLIAQGDLPAFSQLLKEGTRFDLESIEPLMSPILWTTIASGVGAETHGVKSFFQSSNDVTVPRIWDIVEQNGGNVGLLGWPVTWPPREVDGFLIPSLFARGPETFPPELRFVREIAMREKGEQARDLRTYVGYGVRSIEYGVKLTTLLFAARVLFSDLDYLEAASAKRFVKLAIHTDLFVELWERYQPRLGTFYDNAPDAIGHYFWKYYEPERYADVTEEDARRYGDTIPEAYRKADAAIAKILRCLPEDTQVVVVSDHGSGGIETEADGMVRIIHSEKFVEELGLAEDYVAVNLRNLVYLRPADPEARIPGALAEEIRSIKIKETGEDAFLAFADELGNLQVHVAARLELAGRHLLFPDGHETPAQAVIEETNAQISGVHRLNGILLIKGPDTPAGSLGGHASILDVAPTVTYMMGYPIDDGMEGSILERAFSANLLREKPPRSRSYAIDAGPSAAGGESDDEELRSTLRALGYIQ